ncbi:MAG: hypothetical protein WAM94_17170 [Chromatiaceae bacterium]
MTTITFDLLDSLAERAGQAAQTMHRPLEEVITAVLDVALPAPEDVPPAIRPEPVAMTWLDDQALLSIANAAPSDENQRRLVDLSSRDTLTVQEPHDLQTLRDAPAIEAQPGDLALL